MSVIACKITERGYEIAADSILVRGYTQSTGQNIHAAKLFESNGMVIGTVGELEEESLFRLFCATRFPNAATEHALLEFLADFSDWKKARLDNPGIENRYIIGFGGKAFSIERWSVSEIAEYNAIGAGADYALTALHLGHSVEEAVQAAIDLCIYCEPPIIVIRKERD